MELYLSDKPSKRFVIVLDNKKYYFGSPTGYTYLDGADKTARENYRTRHLANNAERTKIENLVPSPALFSYYLTWGESRNIKKNIKTLLKAFKEISVE
jgi:hypothetical protein